MCGKLYISIEMQIYEFNRKQQILFIDYQECWQTIDCIFVFQQSQWPAFYLNIQEIVLSDLNCKNKHSSEKNDDNLFHVFGPKLYQSPHNPLMGSNGSSSLLQPPPIERPAILCVRDFKMQPLKKKVNSKDKLNNKLEQIKYSKSLRPLYRRHRKYLGYQYASQQ